MPPSSIPPMPCHTYNAALLSSTALSIITISQQHKKTTEQTDGLTDQNQRADPEEENECN